VNSNGPGFRFSFADDNFQPQSRQALKLRNFSPLCLNKNVSNFG
jgi:hypothetical protein